MQILFFHSSVHKDTNTKYNLFIFYGKVVHNSQSFLQMAMMILHAMLLYCRPPNKDMSYTISADLQPKLSSAFPVQDFVEFNENEWPKVGFVFCPKGDETTKEN